MNPIVVIPARMASTRLPGKPLADIHGKPMIVHVLERGREAEIGPVAVACGDAEIADAVRAAGGTRGADRSRRCRRGSDRVHAALAELDPDGRHDVVVNLQGDLPTITAGAAARRCWRRWPIRLSTSARWWRRSRRTRRRTLPPFVKAACAFDRGQAVAPALYFSRQPIPWATGRAGTMSASTRIAARRWPASSRCRQSPLEQREKLEQLRALEAGMRIACARVEHGPFGVDTPEDLERARRAAAPGGEPRMSGTIAFQGVPGAYSDLACRAAYPGHDHAALRVVRDAIDAVRDGRADLAMLPCENSLAGRVPDIHHLLPESGLFVIGEQFQRVEHCLLGGEGRHASPT